jgi:hypothetical protein
MYTMSAKSMLKLAADNGGKLPLVAWPGCYPLFYLDADNCTLCPDCANNQLAEDQTADKAGEQYAKNMSIVAYDVHWEGEPIICEGCNKEIESAYGPIEGE